MLFTVLRYYVVKCWNGFKGSGLNFVAGKPTAISNLSVTGCVEQFGMVENAGCNCKLGLGQLIMSIVFADNQVKLNNIDLSNEYINELIFIPCT